MGAYLDDIAGGARGRIGEKERRREGATELDGRDGGRVAVGGEGAGQGKQEQHKHKVGEMHRD